MLTTKKEHYTERIPKDTKKEYFNQAIAFATASHTALMLLVHPTAPPVNTRTLQFRKAYLAMLGIHNDHLSQFATGDSRPQDGHRVHVLHLHLP